MSIFSIKKTLSPYTAEAESILRNEGGASMIKSTEKIGPFFRNLGSVFTLIRQEPEIIGFAILQWIVIGLAYLAWTQALDWIPDSVWDEVRRANDQNRDSGFGLVNLFLLGWSFIVVACAAFPLAILNAAMVSVHCLRHAGYESTFLYALWRGTKNAGRQWVFSTVDGWITVTAILDRLPKKNDRRPRTAADELLYYAWKLATMGMVPAFVHGRGIIGAAKDSLTMIKEAPWRAITIRFGYSGLCWIVGVSAYVLTVMAFCGMRFDDHGRNEIYNFYFMMVVPIFIAVGIVSVLVRPFFLLMVAKLYTDILQPGDIITAQAEEDEDTAHRSFLYLLCFASLLIAAVIIAALFGDQLGLTAWVESLAQKDFARMSK